MVCVRWETGHTSKFVSRNMATDEILINFAETGVNSVEEVWEEDTEGNEVSLGLHWTISLDEI